MQIIKPAIYIIDDNEAICEALHWLIESTLELPVINYTDANKFLADYNPKLYGCLLIDVLMPGINGFDLLDTLKQKGNKMPVIMLTGHGDIPMAVKAMRAGAKDFITKPFDSQELIEKIRQVLAEYTKQFSLQQQYMDLYSQLTKRERDIMKCIVSGKLNKEIANEIGIALKTVELHRFNIMHKLKIRNVAELIHIHNLLEQKH